MGKFIRTVVAIIVILSFVLLGRNQAAWAANSGADSSASEQSVSPDKNKGCDNDDKHRRDDCDDDEDDDDNGTVKPPRHRVKACKVGSFSVGGVATIQIKRLGRGDCVTAFTKAYDPEHDPRLPSGTRLLTDVLSVKLPKKNASVKICFAAPPGKNAGLYTISHGAWTAVGSSSKGVVCTGTSKSGTFVLLGK